MTTLDIRYARALNVSYDAERAGTSGAYVVASDAWNEAGHADATNRARYRAKVLATPKTEMERFDAFRIRCAAGFFVAESESIAERALDLGRLDGTVFEVLWAVFRDLDLEIPGHPVTARDVGEAFYRAATQLGVEEACAYAGEAFVREATAT